MLVDISVQVHGLNVPSCNADYQAAIMCNTRGEADDHTDNEECEHARQERMQARYPLWIWNSWGRTHKVQNRSNQWLHKINLGPNKKILKKRMWTRNPPWLWNRLLWGGTLIPRLRNLSRSKQEDRRLLFHPYASCPSLYLVRPHIS